MPVSVTMPRLGESVTEGTVTRWLKQEGERVEADEPLLEVSTDKVDTEIPSPAAGILSSITVAEDETVEVGAELAVIAQEGEAGADSQQAPAVPEPPQPEPAPAAPAAPSGDSPYVTPLVRKLASEHDVDLASIKGTGVGGRIRKQDVLEAARAKQAPPPPPEPPAPAPVPQATPPAAAAQAPVAPAAPA